MAPDYANGKICYIDIPAADAAASSEFYEKTFAWTIRTRGNGSVTFTDTVGQVSGTWVVGRQPATEPGLLIYIMVDNAEATIQKIVTNGCKITQPIGGDAPEITARFRVPAGNTFGIYQQPEG